MPPSDTVPGDRAPLAAALRAAAFLILPLAVLAPLGEAMLLLALAVAAVALAGRHGIVAAAARSRWVWPLLALAVWGAVSAAWTAAPEGTVGLSVSLAALFAAAALLFAASGGLGPADRERLLRWAWVGFAVGVALLAVELLAGLPISGALRGLPPEAERASHEVNRAVTVLALVVWPLAATTGFSIRGLGLPAVLAAVALAASSASSASVVALAVGGAVYAAVHAGGATVVRVLGVLAAALVAVAPLLAAAAPEVIAAGFFGEQRSWLHRLHTWDFTAERIFERPLLGWGLGAAPHLPGADDAVLGELTALSLHPHNFALQLWVELGVAGAAAGAALVWACVRAIAAVPAVAARAGAAAAFASAFVIASLSYGVWQNWWIATLALTAALTRATLPAAPREPAGA